MTSHQFQTVFEETVAAELRQWRQGSMQWQGRERQRKEHSIGSHYWVGNRDQKAHVSYIFTKSLITSKT